MIIVEVFPGSGKQWRHPNILARQEWLDKNLDEDSYKIWYQGLKSDTRYIEFYNDEDAVLYKLRWMNNG